MFREFFGSLVSLLRRDRQPAPQQHERDVEQGTMATEDTFRSVDQNINQQQQQQPPPQPKSILQQRFHIGKPINMVTDPSAAVIQTICTNTADDDHYCLNSFNKKYRMVHILGSGGYGFVWSGYQISNRFEVAIKVVRGIKAVDENNDRIIPKEVQLMQAAANVPGVIRLLDWYLVDGNLYIVMEQPERAIDMYDYLRDWIVLSEDKARDMFRQVVQSVVGCFKLGIVHCDVKDQNLLVSRNSNETTLIDFGSGYFVHELAGRVPFKGTRIHAPPEFIEFKRYLADPATVWSLGTLLFTMVFCRPPFVNDDEILEAKVEFPRVISPECGSLIRKLLTRDPNKRITLETILQENWFKADNSSGRRRNIEHWLGHPNFELLHHDVVNPLYVEVDEIYHLASPASPPHYMMNAVKTIKTNTVGTINMLGLAKRVGARILVASTSEVYGDPVEHPQSESYWGHVNPICPRSCYDEGKRVADSLTVAYAKQEKLDVRIARIFNTYEPRMHVSDGRVVSNFISQALQGQKLTIYGEGHQTRSFQFVYDLVDGLDRLMASNFTTPVNLDNPQEYTINQFATVVLDLVHGNSTASGWENIPSREKVPEKYAPYLQFYPSPQDDPRRRRPDISLARRVLNWYPNITVADGLSRTIDYFRGELKLSLGN